MNLQHSSENKSGYGNHNSLMLFFLLLACAASLSFFPVSYAQTLEPPQQQTLSDNLLNDPLAQDLLKKIEQTKKMIADLEQKEYEKNQAQEQLQKMRDVSLERLNKNLDEWERLWEKQSSRNAFESFVNKKPEYVQGVFWDQFEFKEQKVNAGKIAMMQVLANGGTMQDAKEAYNKAASSKRVEIIEMNAQFNIKHNLATHAEQLIFDSSGKAHLSSTTYNKLGNLYSDYKLQPNYILANQEQKDSSILSSEQDDDCSMGKVLVQRLTSGNQSCVEESVAKKWINNGIHGLKIVGEKFPPSSVVTNPGTQCKTEQMVVYHIENKEYQCVLEYDAKQMLAQKTVEIHTLVDYIDSKDVLKKYEDTIYEINQEILQITENYDNQVRMIKTEIGTVMEKEKEETRLQISGAVVLYRDGILTKEQISDKILEIENEGKKTLDQLSYKLQEKLDRLESQYRQNLASAVTGYEDNSDINIDWDYLNDEDIIPTAVNAQNENIKISISEDNPKSIQDSILLNDVSIVNSFGQRFDEIKADQILQISADISNLQTYSNDFAYVVQITDTENNIAQPARWITGTLNPEQNFNVSLSWVPEKTGMYNATVSLGSSIDSVLPVADVEIDVNPGGDPTSENYCKKGHELLFKYSDNSPICVSDDTAFKLINIGLAFA